MGNQDIQCDFLFCGAGLASLTLAGNMAKNTFYKNKKIILLESDAHKNNDRTWSFWGTPNHPFAELALKKWSFIQLATEKEQLRLNLSPFQFFTIRSSVFYKKVYNELVDAGIEIHKEKVLTVTDRGQDVCVKTESGKVYTSGKVFNSIFEPADIKQQKKYPYLKQHFVGWWVETEKTVFDPSTAVFMDFDLASKGETRFMYVLPVSEKKALVEYTLFTDSLLKPEEYNAGITDYLNKIGADNYQITEREAGNIPMTAYRFENKNSKNVMYIGTAGGWTKASTGFTFTRTQKISQNLISFLASNEDFRRFSLYKSKRFRFYDLLLLDVLHRKNELGSAIFFTIFKKNPPDRVLRFLDEETRLAEDIKIIGSCPKRPFIQALFHRLLSFSF